MIRRLVFIVAAAVSALSISGFTLLDPIGVEGTTLRFQGALQFRIGDDIAFLLLLETEAGRPIAFQEIEIYLDGEPAGTVVTDALGAAGFHPGLQLVPGDYTVSAVYRGFQFYGPAAAVSAIKVEPAEIVVQTVPVIAGLAFSLDGEVRTTGADGIVRFSLDRPGSYDIELLPDQEVLEEAGAEFERWWPAGFETIFTVPVPGAEWVQAGFELGYPAEFHFVDPEGETVAGERIDSARLRGSDGSVYTFTAGETLFLNSNQILARLNGLDSVAVVHSVQSVIVDGVEVVNRGQQRFIFAPEESIEIEVLFYDVRFFSRDLLLGRPVGREFELVFPDGERVVYPLDENGEGVVTDLARGEYEARLLIGAGLAPRFPIVLSRDQAIGLPVISLVDLSAGITFAAAGLIGLPVIGRRRQILDFLKRSLRSRKAG